MINTKQTASRLTFGMPAYALFVILYILLIIMLPISHDSTQIYHLSHGNYRLLLFIISLPLMLVWLAAFLSYNLLKDYTETVKKTAEGGHFNRLAQGGAWLAWSLPITAIIDLVLTSFGLRWTGLHPAATIIGNYIDLVIPLVAFTIINDAARGLFAHAKLSYNLVSTRLLTFVFVFLGVIYCFLTFRHFDLSSLGSTHNPYFLPIWLMVLTVAIPYLYAWFVGILAAYELMLYSREVKGVFYRQALHLMVIGLVTVIGSFIAQQYLNNAAPRLGHVLLDYRLAIVLVLRIIAGIGFTIMAMGAVKLKRIETI